jgi:Pin2-interacting protein X1
MLLQAEHAHKLRDWTTGMVGYDAILTGLKEITARGSSSSGGSSSSSDSEDSSGQGGPSGYDSDSDTSGGAPAKPAAVAVKQDSQKTKSKKAAAAAAAADKKQNKKRGKKQQRSAAAADADAPAAKRAKKADSSSSDSDSGSESESSGSGSDSDAEPAAAAAAAGIKVPAKVSRVKAASHLGRYQKREKAKTVRNYSAGDLAAILGLPGSAPPVANGEGAAGWAAAAAVSNPAGAGAGSSSSGSDGSDSDSDSEAGAERNSSDQQLRPSTPPGSDSPPSRSQQRGLGDIGKTLNPVVDEELQPVSDDAGEGLAGQRVWWRSVFVRAGRTGGGAPPAAAAGGGKQHINISGFQEEDQTNLYMQVRLPQFRIASLSSLI